MMDSCHFGFMPGQNLTFKDIQALKLEDEPTNSKKDMKCVQECKLTRKEKKKLPDYEDTHFGNKLKTLKTMLQKKKSGTTIGNAQKKSKSKMVPKQSV